MTNIIKPLYNSRQTMRKIAAVKSIQERDQKLAEAQQAESDSFKQSLNESTFTRMKTKANDRREFNRQRKLSLHESIIHAIAEIATHALESTLNEDIAAAASSSPLFNKMKEMTATYITKDTAISAAVGDISNRVSVIDMGNTAKLYANQMMVGIVSRFDPISRTSKPTFAEPITDNPNPATSMSMNLIDQLVSFGDLDKGDSKSGQLGNLQEMYSAFVEVAAGKVSTSVALALKEEAEAQEMKDFLDENYTEDKYAATSNRTLVRKANKPTLFREMCKTVKVLSENVEYRDDKILNETIAQYTLLETFKMLDLLGKTEEQLIGEFIIQRRQANLAKL